MVIQLKFYKWVKSWNISYLLNIVDIFDIMLIVNKALYAEWGYSFNLDII